MLSFQKIKMISDLVYKIAYWVGATLLSLIFIIMLLQVFCRYALKKALVWPEETSIFLFVWAALIGASMVLRDREHVGINFVIDLCPVRLRNVVKLLTDFLAAFFAGYLVIYGWRISVFVGLKQATTFWNIPYFYLYLSVCVGGLLLLIQALFLITEDLPDILTPKRD
jgi:TRAP-type C4-dicarboxylate transport system permease small subunit